MKKIINLLSIILYMVTFTSCGINQFYTDAFENDQNETPPILLFTYKSIESIPKTTGFLADGFTILQVDIVLKPSINIIENRKISLSTSVGNFIVNGEEKKAIEIKLDESGNGIAYIKSPVLAGSGIITASSANGIAKHEKSLVFGLSLPETVIIETPTYIISDSSSTPINISLTRGQGNVSDGQKGTFQLMSGMTVLGDRVSFIESSSSKDGKASCKMILEKIPIGKYKIKATFGGKDGEREIEVVKIEPPKTTK